ncbi:hypothetical protein BACERE00184_05780 [Bacillus cereus]|nr:hypothetical protein BACERE00184_05780 [Bacillus cereus]
MSLFKWTVKKYRLMMVVSSWSAMKEQKTKYEFR